MRPWLELLAVFLSAALHFVATLGCHWHGVDVAVLGLAWLGYAAWRARVPGVLAGWGLRRAGLRASARAAAAIGVGGALGCAVLGAWRGTLVFDAHLLPLLLAYPLWGLVQQLLVLGIGAGNLAALGVPRAAVLTFAALGFAAVHVPDWPLCGGTLLLGLGCGALFLRWRNLWPLAVLHGALGALFYRWVLGRDPWAELLSAFA